MAVVLSACGDSEAKGNTTVKIGVNGSDGAQWPILKEKAAKEGIDIELVEFEDYTLPNNALAQGDIDLNAFQTVVFLAQYNKESGNDIVPIGSTVFAPLGLYSKKIKDVSEIKKGDQIAIPDDPTNQARALKLLEAAKLIKLDDDFGLFDGTDKIAENPLNLKITPMVAQQTPRSLEDVTAATINNGIAGQAGFNPGKDPIFKESAEDDAAIPYVNLIAARAEDKDNKVYKRIVELYQEKDIQKAINEDTNGGSILQVLPQDKLDDVFNDLKK
ncbi:MetQ/NlpA family ABC transporter substrate-binding protein [Virgibacillus sp. 179-BFC.A HS]|uniref:Lipoprotein n=1 Tax=Tigheibacillus jepli TaxID=3035914 RepID=A0ABU5CEI1_9BACI|nr:MetQ/NlpA family ABC transporter substrate-binding protein [Virgibacillus sp. 179-BFC.A HS]MDY0404234.1 MetQ/NlpA family ABC transporter substrate-binding protein [Virgibacillus sp. 179-BFC.A HS]